MRFVISITYPELDTGFSFYYLTFISSALIVPTEKKVFFLNGVLQNGHVGFMLSCYDAELRYDARTDTFQAR